MKLISNHPQKTKKLGRWLSRFLMPGDLVKLSGDLGAGKTTFAQGIAEGLEVAGYVPSPTFIIVHRHEGVYPLFHIDLYRLSNPLELKDLAIDEMLEEGIVLVEWPEKAEQLIGHSHLRVSFEYDNETHRSIEFTEMNDRFEEIFRTFDPLIVELP